MNRSAIRLSLSMIVRDEEEFLPGCLASVQDIVDETVIVDTGSRDRTVDIARQAGATVIETEWQGDFSIARNRSLDACQGEWVLYLDADERFAGGQSAEIASMLAQPRADAYQLLVRSTLSLEGGKKGVQVMPYPRLFRRTKGVRFERQVHEQIAPSILRNGGTIASTNLVIEHLGYDRGFEYLQKKIQRNLEGLLRMVERDPGDWYARLQLARSSMLLQDYDAVVREASAALRASAVSRSALCALHNLMAEAALKTRNAGAAIQHCETSLALYPGQVGAAWFLAGAHMTDGNPRPAIVVLEGLLTRLRSEVETADIGDLVIPQSAVEEALGQCYLAVGNWERAAGSLASALAHGVLTAGTSDRLIGALEKLGRPAVSLRCLRIAADRKVIDPRLLCYLAMTEHVEGDDEKAINILDRVLLERPNDPVALSWKALWSLRHREFEAAASVLRIADEKGIHTDDLDRCAFELALQKGRFAEALERLDTVERLYSPDDYRALKAKVSLLAKNGLGTN